MTGALSGTACFRNKWFYRNRKLFASRNVLRLYAVAVAVLVLVWASFMLAYPYALTLECAAERHMPSYERKGADRWSPFVSMAVAVVLGVTVTPLAVWIIGKYGRDAVGIRMEVRATLFISFVVNAFDVAGGCRLTSPGHMRNCTSWVHVFLWTSLSIVNFGVPILRAWKTRRNRKRQVGVTGQLKALLATKIGYSSFLAYLGTEFSAENLLFCKESVVFKHKYSVGSDRPVMVEGVLSDEYHFKGITISQQSYSNYTLITL